MTGFYQPGLADLRITPRFPVEPGWRERLAEHLLSLNPESRLNRFLAWASDSSIRRYAETTTPVLTLDAVENGRLVGIAELHLQNDPFPKGEIALSVAEERRRAGVGQALFDAAIEESRRRGVWDIWIYYLTRNDAMRKISGRAGFARVAGHDGSVAQAQAMPTRPPGRLLLHSPGGSLVI